MHKACLLSVLLYVLPLNSQAQCVTEDKADRLIVVPVMQTERIDATTKTISGTIPASAQDAKVLLCLMRDGKFVDDGGHVVTEDGSFTITLKDLQDDDTLTLEVLTKDGRVGPPTKALTVPKKGTVKTLGDFQYNLIAGIDETSFSSLGLNTNPFIQAYIESTEAGFGGARGWGKSKDTWGTTRLYQWHRKQLHRSHRHYH